MDLLIKLARAFDTKGYPDDKNPENWRTINHAPVHIDENGNVDGGAGKKFDGNQWSSQKHPYTVKPKPAPQTPAVTSADLSKAWARVTKYHVAMKQVKGANLKKVHAQNMLSALQDYQDLYKKADPVVQATQKHDVNRAMQHAKNGMSMSAPAAPARRQISPTSGLNALAQATMPPPQQKPPQAPLSGVKKFVARYKDLQQAIQQGQNKAQIQKIMNDLSASEYNALTLQEKKQVWAAAGGKSNYINTINQANGVIGQAQVVATPAPGNTPAAAVQSLANMNLGTAKHPFPIFSAAKQATMKTAATPQDADKDLRGTLVNVWSKATADEKDAAFTYSYSYKQFQETLRGGSWAYGGSTGIPLSRMNWDQLGVRTMGKKPGEVKNLIKNLTSIINKSSYDKDIQLQRGSGIDGLAVMFNCSISALQHANDATLQAMLVGKTGKDEAFTSCGSSSGKGFSSQPVIMHIDCPAGTKMLYIEPFGGWGGDAPYNAQQLYNQGKKCTSYWDGKSPQKKFGEQDETLIQRGTSFTITKAHRVNGQIHVYMQVVSQDPYPIK